MSTSPAVADRFLSTSTVVERTSLSRTTLWRMIRRGEFPKPVHVSPGRVAWSEAALTEWFASKSASAEAA